MPQAKNLSKDQKFGLKVRVITIEKKWHSIIKSLSPYQYVDEMLTGPFKKWRHLHKFYDVDINNNQKQTEVIDEIDFELPYGIIGKLFDGYAYRRLEKLFYNRKLATIRALDTNA